LIGILTDGDLRRVIDHEDLAHEKVTQLMSRKPRRVTEDTLLQDALDILRGAQIDNLVVVDSETKPVGMIDVQDLLRDGLID
jgi:arabinose-5-phosphate isomerase